jgi:hypothetical protein
MVGGPPNTMLRAAIGQDLGLILRARGWAADSVRTEMAGLLSAPSMPSPLPRAHHLPWRIDPGQRSSKTILLKGLQSMKTEAPLVLQTHLANGHEGSRV